MAATPIKAPTVVLQGNRQLTDIISTTGTRVINVMLLIAGAIAVGSLIGYGIMLATAQGDETKTTAAKKGITYSILGIIVITLTLVIANLITKAVLVG
ncbi:MAG: hypothetical protein Q7S64_02050 [bacterium]|nr:hypothetical protein [bacterium]